MLIMREHDDTKSKQDDKACGKSANPAPRDMHDARNLLVDERNEISARDKKLALVFSDDSVSRKTGSGVAARRPYQCRQRFAINRIDEPAALYKTPRGGAGVPELVDALAFKQFARRCGNCERRNGNNEEPCTPTILRDERDERTRHVREDPYFANLDRRVEFRVAARRFARE